MLEKINRCRQQRKTVGGFTLMELMVTVAILAILAAIALPVIKTPLEKQRLIAAAETLLGDLRWARSESIKRNKPISVIFTPGVKWSYCINRNRSCENPIKTVRGDQFSSTTLESAAFNGSSTTFDPVRGINLSAGKATITTEQFSANIVVSPLGHTRICAFPEGGYSDPC